MAERVTGAASPEDVQLVDALRAGDERAFRSLVGREQRSMLRLARTYVSSTAVAEEIVQEAWLGVVRGVDRFEGRSSLRTWIYRILVNTAKTHGAREGRSVPFASLAGDEGEPSVDPDRFLPADHDRFPGHWSSFPPSFDDVPQERLLSGETLDHVRRVIDELPPPQAQVIRLRDVEGWTSQEVCNALELTETNQRVLLHRARTKVRVALENYLVEERTE